MPILFWVVLACLLVIVIGGIAHFAYEEWQYRQFAPRVDALAAEYAEPDEPADEPEWLDRIDVIREHLED